MTRPPIGRRLFSLAALCALAAGADADPIPGHVPPRAGEYDTNWGTATLTIEHPRNLSRGGVGAQFRFANGSVVYGYFLPRPQDRPTAYVFVGRYFLVPGPTGLLATLGPTSACSTPMRHVASTIELPSERRYWGGIRIVWSGAGTAFRGRINPCQEAEPAEVGAVAQFTGSWRDNASTAGTSPNAPAPAMAVPIATGRGPCDAVEDAAATIGPCQVRLLDGFTVTLNRDIDKDFFRVEFTPVIVKLPLQPDGVKRDGGDADKGGAPPSFGLFVDPQRRPVYQDVRGASNRRGEAARVIPPGSVCQGERARDPFANTWAISLRDSPTRVHHGLGVIAIDCRLQPRADDKQPRGALLAVPKERK